MNRNHLLSFWRHRNHAAAKRARVMSGVRGLALYSVAALLSPRFVALAVAVLLAVIFAPATALFGGMFGSTKSYQRLELEFSENNIRDTRVPRGLLFDSLTIDVPWRSTVTADATAVRTRGAPIKYVQFIGDANKVHYSAKLQDIIRMDEIFQKGSLSQILTSPSGVTAVGGPYDARVKLTIPFASTWAYAAELTALASWRQSKDPVLRVQWGSHAEVYRGGTGSAALQPAQTASITLCAIEGFRTNGLTTAQFGDMLGVKVEAYDEKTYTAAQNALKQELPNTADIRAIVITGEDTNGDPLSELEMAKISFDLVENTYNRVQAGLNLGVLRARNANQFGFSNGLPPGTAILDFADDLDILSIYEATKKNKVELVFTTATPAAGTYTIRTHVIGIEPGRAVTMRRVAAA